MSIERSRPTSLCAGHSRARAGLLGMVFALGMPALAATAADLGGKGRDVDYYPVEPRMNLERWTGFYLGATVGGSFGTTGVSTVFGQDAIDARGLTGGILAGYNWQIGRMVLGVESDFSLSKYSGSKSIGGETLAIDMDSIGTLRGRLGFLMTPSMMVYATGGFAWANLDISAAGSSNRYAEFTKGWTAGVGTELMLNPKWTMRLEYLYTDLGDRALNIGSQSNRYDLDHHTVRAGFTFKF